MNNIEVGDYIRDCDGFIVKVNEIQDYKEDDDIWYEENTLKGTWKSMVVKHSKNITNLIEVGDYVNGELITHSKYDVYLSRDFKQEYENILNPLSQNNNFKQ